jgi:hypothetical protein
MGRDHPIFNTFVLLRVCGRPLWWFILLLIPLVNVVILVILSFDLARVFGHGAGYGLGLLLLSIIFYPILGFGSSRYVGSSSAQGTSAARASY